MKKYFEGLLLYMKNLGVNILSTEMAMDRTRMDVWDEEFQGEINGVYKLINMPKQFVKLIDTLVEKYGQEIWYGSQNEWDSEYYRVHITISLPEKKIIITSDIEEQTSEGSSDEYMVHDVLTVQLFLDENKIDDFEVNYYGGGDDGYIEDDGHDENGKKYRISDDLENFLLRRLSESFAGWEINGGSSGKFIINRITLTIEHEWYETEWVKSDLNIVITLDNLN